MWEKKADKYEGTTYAQMRELVHRFAAGLMSLGLEKGDRVALISEGRNDWVMAELGLFFVGAVDVPISVKVDELADLKFRLLHSGCKMAMVSQGHIGKIRAIKADLPELKLTICFDALKSFETDEVSAATVLKKGDEYLGHSRAAFEARWQSVAEGDPANICYTSGTTADPKGIILTHRNYTANIEQGTSLINPQPDWVLLNVLPWDHAFGHTCGIYMMMTCGASIASVQQGKTALETIKNVPLNIRELRPHVFLSVPALAKNFRKTIEKGVRDKGPKVEALFAKAMKTAYAYNKEGWNRGRGAQRLKKPVLALYDKLLFSKIRAGLRRPAEVLRRRRGAARHRAAALLLCRRHPHAPRLRADRGGAGDLGQQPVAPQAGVFRPGHARPAAAHLRLGRQPAARPGRPARSSSGARTSWPATGATRRPPRRPCAAAGSTPATSATSTRTATSMSWAGSRACSSPTTARNTAPS